MSKLAIVKLGGGGLIVIVGIFGRTAGVVCDCAGDDVAEFLLETVDPLDLSEPRAPNLC